MSCQYQHFYLTTGALPTIGPSILPIFRLGPHIHHYHQNSLPDFRLTPLPVSLCASLAPENSMSRCEYCKYEYCKSTGGE